MNANEREAMHEFTFIHVHSRPRLFACIRGLRLTALTAGLALLLLSPMAPRRLEAAATPGAAPARALGQGVSPGESPPGRGGAPASSGESEAEQYFKQAEQMVGTGEENSDRQIALLQKALELNPDLVAAEFNLGIIYSRLQEAEKAQARFNRILERAPAGSSIRVKTLYLSALNLKALGRTSEAKDQVQQVLAANPRHADALALLAGFHLEEGKIPEAKALLEQAVEIDSAIPEAFYSLSYIAQKNGQSAEALKYYEKFVQLVPNNAAAQLNMAILLAGADRMEEAGRYAQMAVRLDPVNADAWMELGKIQMLSNRQADAENSFRRSLSLRSKWSEAHRILVTMYLGANKLGEAEAILQEAEKSNPNEAEVYSLTGELATRTGDTLRALKSYGRAHELNPAAGTAFDFAMAYARSGMDPLAEEYLHRALKLQGNFCEAWLNLGIVEDRQKKEAEAISAYQEAEKCGVREAGLWYRMGLLYARTQETEKAFGYLKRAVDADPPRWKAVLREALKAVTSDLDSIRYQPEFQKLIE
ncbi:MAG: tetratricopeptide repeat protein [Acidobacteria bacterium]|nr:tetratricopeptide repeat protein [Acidobacteriota bacterium]